MICVLEISTIRTLDSERAKRWSSRFIFWSSLSNGPWGGIHSSICPSFLQQPFNGYPVGSLLLGCVGAYLSESFMLENRDMRVQSPTFRRCLFLPFGCVWNHNGCLQSDWNREIGRSWENIIYRWWISSPSAKLL